jgi:protein-tyrosine-phosphatase
MAEVMLRSLVEVPVGSAGFVSDGIPAPPGAVEALRALGLDLSCHRSHRVSGVDVGDAELIVVMERQHLVELTASFAGAWPKTFTFGDLLRRARRLGGRRSPETISQWATRLSTGRRRAEVWSLPLADDLADPMGGGPDDFVRTRDQLGAMVGQLAPLLEPA